MSVNQTNIISKKIFITPGKGIGSPISNRNIVLILVQFRKKSNTICQVQHLVNFERDQRKRVALNFSKELNQPHLFLQCAHFFLHSLTLLRWKKEFEWILLVSHFYSLISYAATEGISFSLYNQLKLVPFGSLHISSSIGCDKKLVHRK